MNPWFSVLVALASSSSPWSPAEWRLLLNLGREPDTYMPAEWGASGARLALPVEVLVESETIDVGKERSFLTGNKCYCLSVLEDPTFVGPSGEETVRLGDTGGWKIASRRTGRPGDAGVLRFWLDLVDRAVRNDVSIDAGERLYCTANCWRESELEAGRRRIQPLVQKYQEAQERIDQRLPHETGDRRLDGTNPVETVKAYADMAVLVKNRDDRLQELRDAERKLPSPQLELSKPGRWPGTTELVVLAPGKVVVQRRNAFGVEEFYIVGSWTATPLEGVSEYYEEEEETEDASSE